jgi:predicted metallopeptidase
MLKTLFIYTATRSSVMSIKYYEAPDIKRLIDTIVTELEFIHINPKYVYCFRSRGSKSKRTIARVHSLEKLWQLAMKTHPRYLIEVIAERYDKLSQTDKEKVLIHELLHIPKGFSGGFRPHKGYINRKSIDKLHKRFQHSKKVKKVVSAGRR